MKYVNLCRVGWKNLYQPIIDLILNYDMNQNDPNKKIGLRRISNYDGKMYFSLFHRENATQHLISQIKNAENESQFVCEFCGKRHVNDQTNPNNVGFAISQEQKVVCCNKCYNQYLASKPRTTKWYNKL